jgi:5-methyltetrahydropteroyltriglutamate--homocysteine methyltransferase
MKRSVRRILTTHAGRLERPAAITQAMEEHPDGRPTDSCFADRLKAAVADIVKAQVGAGIDVVNDGEFGKLSWNTYLNGRLTGHELVPSSQLAPVTPASRDRADFAEFYAELERQGARYYKNPGRAAPPGMRWACTGPVSYRGHDELKQDLAFLRSAMEQSGAAEAFIPSTSPVRPGLNASYPTDIDYYVAVGEAMRVEYQAIVAAGFIVQIDDPYLPELWQRQPAGTTVATYRRQAESYVELVNNALRGIPEDRIRYHICWGSWHGPHTHDLPLKDIADILLKVRAQGYVIEAANARHEHEWQVWADITLPADKILIPGVISHATNVVEHPELVAWRIKNFASIVSPERIIAGTDCGLGYRVHRQIAWAKLKALAEGAREASKSLWRSSGTCAQGLGAQGLGAQIVAPDRERAVRASKEST